MTVSELAYVYRKNKGCTLHDIWYREGSGVLNGVCKYVTQSLLKMDRTLDENKDKRIFYQASYRLEYGFCKQSLRKNETLAS